MTRSACWNAGEERDVKVAPVEAPRVARRYREGHAGESVLHPHAVLEQQRNQADGEGQIESRVLAAESRADRAEVAFEKERVGIGVEVAPPRLLPPLN